MYFPLTAGAVPRGVSVRVYSSPSGAEPSSPGGEGDFVLKLRDSSGTDVFEKRFRLSRPALGLNSKPSVIRRDGGSLSVTDFKRFTVSVVEPPVYDSFAVSWAGRELFTAKKSPSAPSAEVLGVSEGQVFGSQDVIDLCLRGIDDDGDQLTYRVYYSTDDGDTYRLYTGLSESFSPELRVYLGGIHERGLVDRIGVAVSDGVSSVFAESPSFGVVRNESGSYGVRIVSPEGDAVLSAGESVRLDATVWLDARRSTASENVEYRWSSSLDGDLGKGRTVELPADELAVGEHTVTVTATEDSLGLSYVDSVRFFVIPPDVPFEALDETVHLPPHKGVHIYVLRNDAGISESGSSYYDLEVTVPAELGRAKMSYARLDVPYPVISYISRVSGRDSFEYEVCDWDSFCDTATVYVSVGLDDCTIFGTDEDDRLVGTPGDDIICALDGDDTIEGLGGDDIIRGGAGGDTIHGGPGDDYIQGESGDDTIRGGDGEDLILGGDGSDTLYGGAGYDTLGGGNTITEQNPGDKLYYTNTATPATYPELTAEETELLDEAIITCLEATTDTVLRDGTGDNICAQNSRGLCQTTKASNSQKPNLQKQRTAITSFFCKAAGLAQTIAFEPKCPEARDLWECDIDSKEFRDILKRDTQALFSPLAENNHQITEPTIHKLRQLAEALHNFAVPVYRDAPPTIP